MKPNHKFDNIKIQKIGRITSTWGIIFLSFYIIIGITLSIILHPKIISLIGIVLLSCALIFSTTSIICFKKVNKFVRATQNQSGLAHTRFTRVSEAEFDNILQKLIKNNIAIELNTGYQNYKDSWFKSLDAEYLFTIGSDAHDLEKLGDVSGAYYFLESQNIPQERILSLKG